MDSADWKTRAKRAGWRVGAVKDRCVHLECAKQGCHGQVALQLGDLGGEIEPCALPHVRQYSAQTFELYASLVAELQLRRRSLGMSQDDVCAASGLSDGHINKLEAYDRVAQFDTLKLWAQTLGLAISLTPSALPQASAKLIERRASGPEIQAHSSN